MTASGDQQGRNITESLLIKNSLEIQEKINKNKLVKRNKE
jgi:hypothetical protein